jgi:hypothetical protein
LHAEITCTPRAECDERARLLGMTAPRALQVVRALHEARFVLGEYVLRFALGGVVVAGFSATGELFSPKSFSGLFGAAPSVAIASIGLSFVTDGAGSVAIAARWMAVATVAMFAYASACVVLGGRARIPIWVAAVSSWLVWFAAAGGAWLLLHGSLAS